MHEAPKVQDDAAVDALSIDQPAAPAFPVMDGCRGNAWPLHLTHP